ncbi:VCBS domain-containing protein [Pirellulaceae bacterium SH449]
MVITGTNDVPTITVVKVDGAVTEDASTPTLTDSGSVIFAEIDDTDVISSSVALSSTSTTGPAIPADLATALASAVTLTQTGTNDGTIVWDFAIANSLTQYLADGETVTAIYTITVSDDSGTANDTATQEVTVVITGTNDVPTITVVKVTGAVTEDASTPTLSDSGSITFAEIDETDVISSSVALSSTSTTGPAIPADLATALASAVTLNQTGTNDGTIVWDFAIANSLTQYLAEGETVTAIYTITVSDDSGTANDTATQNVTVVITGTNDVPTITVVKVDGAVTEDASTPTLTDSGSVTFAETDETDVISSSVALTSTSTTGPTIPADLATALASAVTLTQTGNNDGTIVWDFALANSLTQYLADGETVTAVYTITVSDDSGTVNDTATQEVTVVITGTNDVPTITVVKVDGAVTEDASTPTLTDSGSVTFAEVDDTDVISSSVALSSTSTTGPAIPTDLATALTSAVTLTQTGTNDGTIVWDFALANSLTQYLAEGETVTAVYTITVSDDSGTANDTATQEVTVVITGTNDVPTITVVKVDGAVTEDASTPTLTDSGSITFAEIDETDVISSSVALSSTSTTGPAIPADLATALASAVTLTQTGTNDGTIVWDFAIANSLTQYLADGETVTAIYTITVSDDSGTANDTATQEVTVVITGTNDVPTITVVKVTGAVTEDASSPTLTDSGAVTFAEIDETDVISSSVALTSTSTTGPAIPADLATALTSAVTLTQTGTNDGTIVWDFTLANSLTQYLAAGETVTAIYTITVSDDSGTANDTATQEVTVVITGTNDVPTITVVKVTGAVTEDASTPTLTDSGSVTFAEVDETDVISSTVALSSTSTTGPAIPADLATALTSAVTLTQTGTNDGTIVWDFALANSLTQYLADGETVTAIYTITVSDDSGTANDTATQNVTVVITGTNDVPTITVVKVDGAVTEDASTPTLTDSGSITFAEIDETDVISSSVALSSTSTTGPAIPADLATALTSAVTLTQTGTNDGTIVWDFAIANSLTQYLAEGETVTAIYTITVSDDSGTANDTATQELTVVITGTNDVPTITVVKVGGAVIEDASTPTLTDSGSITFAEVDETDVIGSSVALASTSTTGPAIPVDLATALASAVTLTQTGTNDGTIVWDFALDNSLTQYLADGETVTAVYTITVSDDSGTANDTATQEVTVVITGTNDVPTITVVKVTGAVTEDDSTPTLADSGSITFAEVDDTDVINSSVALSSTSTTGPAIPSDLATALASAVTLTQTGTNDGTIVWDFALANSLTQYLADGETVTAVYTITVSDDSGTSNDTATQDVTVVITGTNDAPQIIIEYDNSAGVLLGVTGSSLEADGTLTVTDLDRTDTVTATITNFSKFGQTVGLTLSDAELEAFLSLVDTNIISNTQQSGTIEWRFDSDGYTFGYLGAGQSLTLTYTITATDSQNFSALQDVTIVINGVNTAPGITVEIGDSDNVALTETNSTLSSSGTLSVVDINTTDTVTAAITSVLVSGTTTGLQSNEAGLLAMLSLVETNIIDGTSETGQVAWAFNSGSEAFDYLAVGESLVLTYTITVTDSENDTGTQNVTIVINGTNDAPQLTAGYLHVAENSPISTVVGQLTGTDLDASDVLTYSLLNNAGGRFAINSATGVIVVSNGTLLDYETNTNHAVLARVTDSAGAFAELWLTIIVDDVNEAPVARDNRYSTSFIDDLVVSGSGILANDFDPDGDQLTAVLVSGPIRGTLLSFSPTGSFRYRPEAGFQGTVELAYMVTDGELFSNVATVRIEVVMPAVAQPSSSSSSSTSSSSSSTSSSSAASGPTGNPSQNMGFVAKPISPTNVQNQNTDNDSDDAARAAAMTERLPIAIEQTQESQSSDLKVGFARQTAYAATQFGTFTSNAVRFEYFVGDKGRDFVESDSLEIRDERRRSFDDREKSNVQFAMDSLVVKTVVGSGVMLMVMQGAQLAATLMAVNPTLLQFDPMTVMAGSRRGEREVLSKGEKLFDK